jgi:hypothetical protein
MAVLAAARLALGKTSALGDALKGVYTFGQPKVVTNESVAVLQRAIGPIVHRHVYLNDVVPVMPPPAVGPFAHFGQAYRPKWDESSESFTGWEPDPSVPGAGYLFELPAAFFGYVLGKFPVLVPVMRRLRFPTIEDHFPAHYVEISKVGAGLEVSAASDSPGRLFMGVQALEDTVENVGRLWRGRSPFFGLRPQRAGVERRDEKAKAPHTNGADREGG